MTLRDFLKTLAKYYSEFAEPYFDIGAAGTADFVRGVFLAAKSAKDEPFADASLPQKLYSGNSKLSQKLAKSILANLSKDEFTVFLSNLDSDDAFVMLANDFQLSFSSSDELFNRIFDVFTGILNDAASGLGSAKKRGNTKTPVSEPEIIRRNAVDWLADYKLRKSVRVDPDILPYIEIDGTFSAEPDLLLPNLLIEHLPNVQFVLLYGEGGIGKSYVLFDLCEKLLSNGNFIPLYIPMKDLMRTDESPALQYAYDKYFAQLDWRRDTNRLKSSIRDMLISSSARFIFILDGLNEYAISASESENRTIIEEMRWLQNNRNVLVIASSRGRKGYDDAYTIKVMPLDSNRVREYLKKHENTSNIDLSSVTENFINLLKLPLMLSMFTKTYSPEHTGLGGVDINSITKHSDILSLCVEYHKNRLQKTGAVNYALDILLPIVSLDTNMQMNLDKAELAEQAYTELQRTMTGSYKKLWLGNKGFNQKEIAKLGSDEIELFNSLIQETILDNAMFLVDNEEMVSWQHELLLDWFVAKGIIVNLSYQRELAIKKIESIADEVSKSDVRAAGLLPIALFLYEMLENTPESETATFVSLLTALSRSYHYAKDSANIYKFTALALAKIDNGSADSYEPWKRADLISGNAYMMLSVSKSEMSDDFSYSDCIDTSKLYLDKALAIITKSNLENTKDVRITEAKLYGNLGANCLAKHKLTGDLAYVSQALVYHQKGFEIRSLLFGDFPDMPDIHTHLGSSYNSMATDYFYLGDYEQALENHREAILHREKADVNMRKIESYTRCISTLLKLVALNGKNRVTNIAEVTELSNRALTYPPCFISNKRELRSLRDSCKSLIGYANDRETNGNTITTIRDIAIRIDALCTEVSLDSDLAALFSE
jgi:hypothetical protein